MYLLPFSQAHASLVASWPRSADEVLLWCGGKEFPLPVETVLDWQLDDEVQSYLLIDDEVPVGYGELWLDAEENEVELARIILSPDVRGRGLGQALTRDLLAAARRTGYADVFLRVHPDNATALRCYAAAGFVPVAAELAAEWNEPQPVDYVWLQPGDKDIVAPS